MKNTLLKKSILLCLFALAQLGLMAQTMVEIPAPIATSSSGRGPNGSKTYHYVCAIYPASELGALSNSVINSIGFDIELGANIDVNGNIKIYLENTSNTTYSKASDNWANVTSTMTVVYNGPVTIPMSKGIYNIPLTTPFTYGGNGLYLAYEYSNPSGTRSTGSATYKCNNSLTASLKTTSSTSATVPTTLGATASSFRPCINFGYQTLGQDIHVYGLATVSNKVENGNYPVVIGITNTGDTDVPAGYPVMLISGNDTITESGPAVAAGDSVIYFYSGSWHPTMGNFRYDLIASVEAPGDVVAINNDFHSLHYVFSKYSTPLREDFNDDTRFYTTATGLAVPSDWATLNEDGSTGAGSYNWFISPQVVTTNYEGFQSVANNFNAANGFLIDDWLIAPTVNNYCQGITDSLIFFATSASSPYADSVEVLLAPDNAGTAASDFAISVAYINVPKTGWGRFAYRLNDFLPATTGSYRVALRYLVYDGGATGNNSDNIAIDALSIDRYNKPDAGLDKNVCLNSSVTITASDVPGATGYVWTGPNGYTANTQSITINNVTATEAGNYYVMAVTDTCIGLADTVAVNLIMPPVAIASADMNVCEGANASFGVATTPMGATVNWTGPNSFSSTSANITLNNITATEAGNYIVVADLNGCTGDADTIMINVVTPPTVSAGADQAVCEGSNVNLSATSATGTSFTWSGPAGYSNSSQNPTISTISPLEAGDYIVTASNGTCTSMADTVAISVTQLPLVSISGNPGACPGGTVNLSATSGQVVTDYNWSGPNGFTATTASITLNNLTPADTGVYSVSVANGTCNGPSPSSVTVTIGTLPTVSASGDQQICEGNNASFTANATPSNVNYSWTGPNGYTANTSTINFNNATVLESGEYIITVDDNGCAGLSDTVILTVDAMPVVTISGDTVYCEGQNMVLTANVTGSSTGYSWNGANGHISTSQNILVNNIAMADAGVYSVAVNNGTCLSNTVSVNVVVDAVPSITASNDTTICEGANVDLGANSTSPITWTGPNGYTASGMMASVTNASTANAGLYIATADNNGCTNSASVNLVVNPAPGAALGMDVVSCMGDTVVLTANTNGSMDFVWNTLDTTQSISVTTTNTYSVLVTNPSTGCVSADDVLVTFTDTTAHADASFSNNNTLTVDFTNLSTGANTYLWDFDNDGSIDDSTTNPTHTYPGNAVYTVHLLVMNACGGTDDTLIVVDLLTVGMVNAGVQSLNVSPNPTLNSVNINFEANSANLTVELVSVSGQIIYTENYNQFSGTYRKQVDLSNYAQGVYYVKLITDKGVITKKVVKQ